ncbi:ferrous iron transport protein A [Desulfobulbus rhabdoformis]|uniref:FeoA family protein n=1 Tax=Desulfobulbus rhabdoformis TaxID=34032 RepID=UPI0019661E56|nr:FeoA family protein [Desulfobulbus rhabdoformis]MBM9612817.1 ferrous iron transport protein A [Desulfobulbus rhabdoformis]
MKHRKRNRCCRLCDIPPGQTTRIRCHHAKGAIRQRLLDLGFVPESEVDVVRRAPLGDPIQCKVADYNVTLRNAEAALIEVEEVSPESA